MPKKYRLPLLILLLLFLAVIVIVPLAQQANHLGFVALNTRLYRWCRNTIVEIQPCNTFAARWQHNDTVAACDRLSPDLDSPFQACLTAEGIAPR